ncbi:hypothetical protein BD311DRAFT_555001, partial [Dichomitus squalens]
VFWASHWLIPGCFPTQQLQRLLTRDVRPHVVSASHPSTLTGRQVPANISFDQAATVPLAFATAVTPIWASEDGAKSARFTPPWEAGGTTKYAGKAALVLGGSTSVGQFVIQCARMQGFSPIIATSSPRNAAFLNSLGATDVLDRSLPPSDIKSALEREEGRGQADRAGVGELQRPREQGARGGDLQAADGVARDGCDRAEQSGGAPERACGGRGGAGEDADGIGQRRQARCAYFRDPVNVRV